MPTALPALMALGSTYKVSRALFDWSFPTKSLTAQKEMKIDANFPLKLLHVFPGINAHNKTLGAFTATTTNTMKY